MKRWVIAGMALVVSAATNGWAADPEEGEKVYKRFCFACHDVGENAKTKLGPVLNGIEGRKAGTIEGFNYSNANKSSGIVWTAESFSKYIRAPMQEMPGTKMAFVGVKNDNDVANLWAYLAQFGPDGKKK